MNIESKCLGQRTAGVRRRFAEVPAVLFALSAHVCIAGEAIEEPAAPGTPAVEETRATPRAAGLGDAPSLRMSTDYAQPGLGFGTYTPLNQVESRGVRVEPFTIRAAVQTGIGYDDNVALSSTNRTGSMFSTVSPSVLASLEGATQRYSFAYRGNYGVYASKAQKDYADHNVSLNAANSWTARLRTMLNYDFLRGHTPLGLTSSGTADRWTVQTARGNVAYGAVGAQGGVEGGVAYITRRYDTDTSAFADYDRMEANGTFYYRLGPKTRTFVQGVWANVDHPRDPTVDNKEKQVSVGVTWEALATTTGRARVGYTTKDFASPARPDFGGANYEAAVTWAPRPYSTVDVGVSRFLTESYELGSNFVINTTARVLWMHQWPRQISSALSYAYGDTSQEGLNRDDTYHSFAARVSYAVRRYMRVGAEVRRDTRDSTTANFDYKRNIVLLTVEGAL